MSLSIVSVLVRSEYAVHWEADPLRLGVPSAATGRLFNRFKFVILFGRLNGNE